jgi:uncharacterized protein (DUF2384 family)
MAVRHVSTIEELEAQLENPTPEAIRARAVEVFANEDKASGWLSDRSVNFDDRSPDEVMATDDIEGMREVLRVLLRIESGAVG